MDKNLNVLTMNASSVEYTRDISEVRRNLRWVRNHRTKQNMVWLTMRIPVDKVYTVDQMCHQFNRGKWEKRTSDRAKKSW